MTELSLFVKAAPIMILRYTAFTLIALTMHTASGFLVCRDTLACNQVAWVEIRTLRSHDFTGFG